jgi:hypothetical protein
MTETEKSDGDDQLREEEEERCACDVQNPFVTEGIEVSEARRVNQVA